MDLAWFFTPVLGALIGYSTNWIAIRMLFRPHNEITLFGVRLPFTPGLLPRERLAMSKKIGETLSGNVITDDALVAAITAPEVTEGVMRSADAVFDRLAGDTRTIGELCAEITRGADVDLEGILRSAARKIILAALREHNISEMLTDKVIGLIKAGLGSRFSFGNSAAEILPGELTEWAAKPVLPRMPKIIGCVKSALDGNPEIEEALSRFVAKVAAEQFGSFMGLFIKYNGLYDKIKASVFEYFEDEGNMAAAAEKLDEWVAVALNTPLGELMNKLPQFEGLTERFIGMIDGELESAVAGLIDKSLEEAVGLAEEAAVKVLDVRVCDISGFIGHIRPFIGKAAVPLLHKGGSFVVKSMDVAGLIEGQINKFGAAEAERVVLGVIAKHLRWIMALGGVLGFIIGLVPVIIGLISA